MSISYASPQPPSHAMTTEQKLDNAEAKTFLFSLGFFPRECMTFGCTHEPYAPCENGACYRHCMCRRKLWAWQQREKLKKERGMCAAPGCPSVCMPKRKVCNNHRSFQPLYRPKKVHLPKVVHNLKLGKLYADMKQVTFERDRHGNPIKRTEKPVKTLLKSSMHEWGLSNKFNFKTGGDFNRPR